jgi:hypothetical protein
VHVHAYAYVHVDERICYVHVNVRVLVHVLVSYSMFLPNTTIEPEDVMRYRILATLIFIAAGLAAPAHAQEGEDAAVREAVGHYLQGHATGDGAHFRMVFHPDSKLFWIQNGELRQRTSADYIGAAPGHPAVDEAQRKRRIEHVDVTGDAAIAKVILDHPGVILTDYLSLLRINGEWKVVNKIFTREQKN